jgi:hypothetical protein
MQVAELQQVLQLCDDFASMTEGFGCRPVPALRAAVQLQCKSYLGHLHQHTFTNLTGLHQDNPLDMPDASPRCCYKFCRNANVFPEHKQHHNACTGMLHASYLLLMHALSVNHSQLVRPNEGLEMHMAPSVFMPRIQEGGCHLF